MRNILFAVCLLSLVPTAKVAAQDFDVSLETVRSWDVESGLVDGLPTDTDLALAGRQTVTTAWTDQGGLSHSITTARKTNEDAIDWAERHKEAVDAFQEVFPPVPRNQ